MAGGGEAHGRSGKGGGGVEPWAMARRSIAPSTPPEEFCVAGGAVGLGAGGAGEGTGSRRGLGGGENSHLSILLLLQTQPGSCLQTRPPVVPPDPPRVFSQAGGSCCPLQPHTPHQGPRLPRSSARGHKARKKERKRASLFFVQCKDPPVLYSPPTEAVTRAGPGAR